MTVTLETSGLHTAHTANEFSHERKHQSCKRASSSPFLPQVTRLAPLAPRSHGLNSCLSGLKIEDAEGTIEQRFGPVSLQAGSDQGPAYQTQGT
jgi:hypothetical protein